jgi:hypothetical protein
LIGALALVWPWPKSPEGWVKLNGFRLVLLSALAVVALLPK